MSWEAVVLLLFGTFLGAAVFAAGFWHCSRLKIWSEKPRIEMEAAEEVEKRKDQRRQMIIKDLIGEPKGPSSSPLGSPPPMPSDVREKKAEETWQKILSQE